jgi:hypothetical protein
MTLKVATLSPSMHIAGKTVVTENPSPIRAEACHVANAVID